ncbi:serine/threonineeeee-protein kinase [Sporothrix brasiliensis 5110]|uniref:Serine/threonineeeee-protein kinase n=1 Tax=Sporothrix brasiliensis 5110 TaxID=1398154 RepID=A0A0C2F5G8_9PEZI|nr:serine/threonineeeee-protein kinase [Sporothrix brasiliensis 5110]KIH94129.1 serine/threonineeeee-protein kinase [Sporothrix brasiliensis 5110]
MAVLPQSLLEAVTSMSMLRCAALLFVVLPLCYTGIRVVRSPLRRVPGPPVSIITSAVLRWHELRCGRTRYVHALHQRYGPVVRLAPDEVSFASAAAVKEIYNSAGSGYDKTDFYDLFTVYGRRTMFTTLDKETHARRRRILADRYANSNIMRGPALAGIEERAQHFTELCKNAAGGVLDIYESDADIMREVTFDDSIQNRLVSFYSPSFYAIINPVLTWFAKPRETPLADDFVLETAAKTDAAHFTLLARMHEKQQPNAQGSTDEEARLAAGSFDALDTAAESLDHMAAGIDTTGDALCFLMWELSTPRSLHFQERLRRELVENEAKGADALPFDRLPFLDAVIMEGLRCFPAIPMSLPRVVPGQTWGRSAARGEQQADGRVIDGFFLPAGTVVSSQAYSVHRMDAAVFPDPDAFNPDRWLVSDGDADRKRSFFAFASGGRGCIGKHLALVEMKILMRGIYSRFATAPETSMTPEAMEMSDQLISSRPLAQRCLLQFVPLAEVS